MASFFRKKNLNRKGSVIIGVASSEEDLRRSDPHRKMMHWRSGMWKLPSLSICKNSFSTEELTVLVFSVIQLRRKFPILHCLKP
jgi:hypothetical protein